MGTASKNSVSSTQIFVAGGGVDKDISVPRHVSAEREQGIPLFSEGCALDRSI